MRLLLPLVISTTLLALWAEPAQAFFNRRANLPVPGRMTAEPYNPQQYPWHLHGVHIKNPYSTTVISAMPAGCPSEPPPPPFPQPQPMYGCMGSGLPTAPDLINPGPFGVLPWHPPFQGMLLAPPNRGGQGGGQGGYPVPGYGPPQQGGGGPGVFGYHPFARSPRDFFMNGQ